MPIFTKQRGFATQEKFTQPRIPTTETHCLPYYIVINILLFLSFKNITCLVKYPVILGKEVVPTQQGHVLWENLQQKSYLI